MVAYDAAVNNFGAVSLAAAEGSIGGAERYKWASEAISLFDISKGLSKNLSPPTPGVPRNLTDFCRPLAKATSTMKLYMSNFHSAWMLQNDRL